MKDILGQEIKVGGFLIYYDNTLENYTSEYVIKVKKDNLEVVYFEPSLGGYSKIGYESKDLIYTIPIFYKPDIIDWKNEYFKDYKDYKGLQ